MIKTALDEVLTVDEVAKHLKVHRLTVLKKLNEGELTGFRFGRAWRVSREALEELKHGKRNVS